MTREEALTQYTIDESGRITDPGKFEGEAIHVPAFWEVAGDGSGRRLTPTTSRRLTKNPLRRIILSFPVKADKERTKR